MAAAKQKRNLTEGALFIPIISFVVPIILTGMLQIVYNMADNIVVGRYSGDPNALAAVGSTSSLSNLIVNLLMGISGGAGVVVAQSYGAKQYDRLSKAIHTSTVFSILGGIAFCLLGLLISRPALELMGTKEELIDSACLYMRIICLGIPGSAIYNFGAAALRSIGDSKTPLLILSSTGILNVLLNLLFVICFKMTVDGVALATITAQYVSAAVVILILFKRSDEPYSLKMNKMQIDGPSLKRRLMLGIPTGLSGCMFSVSNVILTSGINTLPTTDISAKTIAINIESLVYTAMNSYSPAAMTFPGQNYGARKTERIKKSILYTLLQVTVVGIVGGQVILMFGEPLANLYIDANDPNRVEVMRAAMQLMRFMLSTYFLCGIMDTLSGCLRGLGYSTVPMIVSLVTACLLRALWVFFIFPLERFNSLLGIYTVYPITWILAIVTLAIVLLIVFPKIKKKFEADSEFCSIETKS